LILIDFHCHLDLFDNPVDVASRAEAAHIYVLSVTTTPKAWRKTAALGHGKTYIRTALGLHPQLAHERSNELPLFEALLDETRYVGEIGLDGSPEYGAFADVQKRVFETVLKWSQERGGKILTIHSRRAAEEVLRALKRHQCADTAVLHWFSGTSRELTEAISLGCWFSVGPAMLRSERGRQITAMIPRDRLLTETDGPFGLRGNKPLEPTDVRFAEAALAKIWQIEPKEVSQTLLTNLKTLVGRVPADPNRATGN
jgi:TatD DNase family protein